METDLSVKISIETYNKIKEINNQTKVPFKWIIDQAINSYILTKKITQKNEVLFNEKRYLLFSTRFPRSK